VPNFVKIGQTLLRYDDLTVFFKMAAVRHLGFWKFKFLTVWRLRDPFCDIAIFVATAAILFFEKCKILKVCLL